MLIGDIEGIKEEWNKIVERGEEFSERFYSNLFALDPDLKSLFKRSMRMQGRKVVSMFDTAINKLDKPLTLLPPLLAAGSRHEQYQVKDEHYAIMCEAFIKTLSDLLGDSFSHDKEQCWRHTFDLITNIMINGKERTVDTGDTFNQGTGH